MQVNLVRQCTLGFLNTVLSVYCFSVFCAQLESLNGLSEEPSPTPSPSDPERASESAQTELER